MSIELRTPELDLHLQDEEKREERLKNIEQKIECPRCADIMTLTSDFDKLGYVCQECDLLLVMKQSPFSGELIDIMDQSGVRGLWTLLQNRRHFYLSDINPVFDKLFTSFRTAIEDNGILDKENTSYNDVFDAFRLALRYYKINQSQEKEQVVLA